MNDNNHTNLYEAICNKNLPEKLAFVQSVISCSTFTSSFVPTSTQCNLNKILFNKSNEKREWLLFQNNHFYCAYCLCFSASTVVSLQTGVANVIGNRITDTLNRHDEQHHHLHAKETYERHISDGQFDNKTREILKIIVKIIIFIATHGKHSA